MINSKYKQNNTYYQYRNEPPGSVKGWMNDNINTSSFSIPYFIIIRSNNFKSIPAWSQICIGSTILISNIIPRFFEVFKNIFVVVFFWLSVI
ncbi:hypothetical protein ES705_41418 [subsurface metagenome]